MYVALVRDPEARTRILDATRARGETRFWDCPDRFLLDVGSCKPTALLLELGTSFGKFSLGVLRVVRRRFPSVPVVAYWKLGPAASRDILEVARAGINALVLRGYDDLRLELAAAFDDARNDCIASRTLAAITDCLPESASSVVEHCIRNAGREMTVEDVARALRVSRRALDRNLLLAGVPTANRLMGWSRILVASELLNTPGRSIDRVALELGFVSGSACRNMFRRHLGMTPSQLRKRGGFAYALRAFHEELDARHMAGPRVK